MTGGLGANVLTMDTATTRTSQQVRDHHPKRTIVGTVWDIPTGYLPDATYSDRVSTWAVRVERMYDPVRTMDVEPHETVRGLRHSGRRRAYGPFRMVRVMARTIRFGRSPQALVTSSHPTMTRDRGLTPHVDPCEDHGMTNTTTARTSDTAECIAHMDAIAQAAARGMDDYAIASDPTVIATGRAYAAIAHGATA